MGLVGSKPDDLLTAAEIGKMKFEHCRRKIVWNVAERMVNGGMTAQLPMIEHTVNIAKTLLIKLLMPSGKMNQQCK